MHGLDGAEAAAARNRIETHGAFLDRATGGIDAGALDNGAGIEGLAREFARENRLLIAAQPTRGLDVGSIEFIHKQIVRQRDEGTAVLLVSTELDEVLSLSDRIAVMYAGRIIDIIDAQQTTREEIGLLMAGVKSDGTVVVDPRADSAVIPDAPPPMLADMADDEAQAKDAARTGQSGQLEGGDHG